MTHEWEQTGVRLKEDPVLHSWSVAASQNHDVAAADLAHAIRFGRAQPALEAVAAGGSGLTSDHARAIHFANEMAELRHYEPLIAVDEGRPVLAPGVPQLIRSFDDLGLWDGQPTWDL
jgi:hypothetical protein